MSQLEGSQAGGMSPFVLLRPRTDGMRPTTLERVICFIHFTDSNINFTQKRSHRHTQNNV